MTMEEFIKYLKMQENKDLIITLEGIVSLKLKIKKAIIKYNEDYIIIESEENCFQKIKFDKHQLMKINKEQENMILEFDQLQKVIITIKKEVS